MIIPSTYAVTASRDYDTSHQRIPQISVPAVTAMDFSIFGMGAKSLFYHHLAFLAQSLRS